MFTKWNSKIGLILVAIIVVSTLTIIGISTRAKAQQDVWSANTESLAGITKDKAVARPTFPRDFKLFNLNIEPLRQQLFSIVDSGARQQSTVISLPNADGNIEEYEVFEASNFEPELQARFPEIRAFSGKGISDKYAMLKLSISSQGIQTMVFRTDTENEFIEPYSQDHSIYAVFRSNRQKGGLPWSCTTEERELVTDLNSQLPDSIAPESNTGELRTMRLAQSCNGEYANFFGATSSAQVALVLAAYNATLTRANGTYEKDLAIHLNLIANTTAVIYYTPATDPYTTYNVGNGLDDWNAQLQATLTANIGEANYDIGHMFGRSGGGGNAGCIGCVCVNGQKGSGITSPADNIPMGDNFDIDYVVHEVGHQMGANHTFSFQLEGTGQNKEVGSGITIMGYAGITAQDVAPHSIDTFHETSIAQIQANMATKTCPVTTVMTANHPPVVAAVPNVTIPISTPFTLTGSATDPEGDPITYQWEQNNNATTSGANSVASPTKLTGPNWLSFAPTASPGRTFPKLSTIQAGLFVTPPISGGDAGANIEALSSVARTLNFRLTVRDNRPYVAASTIGQTQFTDTTVTVISTAGPFQVTAPNTGVTWAGGTSQTVTWNVTNTNIAPLSIANVKVTLSTDSGNTFPIVLAASTPNDGSQVVLIPSTSSTNARVKVEAIGNVFFDMSNTNFTISSPTAVMTNLGGHVTASNGAPLGNVVITLLDTNSSATTTISTGKDGKYNFSSIPVGVAYVIAPMLAGYTFNPPNQVIALAGERLDVDFQASTNRMPAVPFDFDGDGKSDVSIFRPTNGGWYVSRSSDHGLAAQQFGLATDRLVPADYDGDGMTDLAVFRDGDWYVLQSSDSAFRAQRFGQSGDIPLPADFDGDAKADLAVFREGNWYILESSSHSTRALQFGISTDKPVMGDFDGDGIADLAVVRNGNWYILQSLNGFRAEQFGVSSDNLVPGDYDGDRKTDLAVFRNGVWMTMLSSNQSFSSLQFGSVTDRPVPGDYDGDGKWDFAVWRSSNANWYVLQSSNKVFSAVHWGLSDDVALPSVYNQ